MALLRNVGGIGMGLTDLSISNDISVDPGTGSTGLNTSIPIVVNTDGGTGPVVRPIYPIDPIIINTTPGPVTSTTPIPSPPILQAIQAQTSKMSNDQYLILLGLGTLYYTMVYERGVVIKNPYVSLAGGLGLLLYSLRNKL